VQSNANADVEDNFEALFTSTRPVNREPFNLEVGFPNLTEDILRLGQYMGPSGLHLSTQTFPSAERDRFAHHTQQMEYLWN